MGGEPLFDPGFLLALKSFVDVHHSIYPSVPPQGIYFKSLVERAFTAVHKPFALIAPGGTNQPRHDLLVEKTRISLKTETGVGTRPNAITITKLCTTEREPWDADTLKERATSHLSRYDVILMLRAIWGKELLRYQLIDIPIEILLRIGDCAPYPIGRRTGRQSLGADVKLPDGKFAFRVHFDGSDGKCSVRGLPVALCENFSGMGKAALAYSQRSDLRKMIQ